MFLKSRFRLIFLALTISCAIFSLNNDNNRVSASTAADDDTDDDDEISKAPSAEDDVVKIEETVQYEPEDYNAPTAPTNAYFHEFFAEEQFPGKWVLSQAKKEGISEDIAQYNGVWKITKPDQPVLKNLYSLIASSKAHHHAISAKFDRPFNFRAKKPFIVQYDVKFQNGLECGGAYIKLLSGQNVNLKQFNDKTPYTIMFGPDKCGMQSKLHFIVRFKNPKTGTVTEHHAKQTDKSLDTYFTDKKSHLYTLELNPDDSYLIYVDQYEVARGNLLENLEPRIIPQKEIDDPNDKKPSDWDEREKIADPSATKPEDWDEDAPEKIEDSQAKMPADWLPDEPEYVTDEKAVKPADWDEEMDGKFEGPLIKNPKCEKASGCGKWTPPMIKNPSYKGKWKAPMINNPAYQGKWLPRKIQNPDFFELASAFEALEPIGALGLELWTMTEGIAFDNFLVVDDKPTADSLAAETWAIKNKAEGRSYAKASIFANLIQTANDKPWLWAVYLLVILVPIVLITIFCFSGSKKDKAAATAKKTDAPGQDDDVMEDNMMDNDFRGQAEESQQQEDGDFEDESPEENQQQKNQAASRQQGTPRDYSPRSGPTLADLDGETTPVASGDLHSQGDNSRKSKSPTSKKNVGDNNNNSSHNSSNRSSTSPKKVTKADLEESSGDESGPEAFKNNNNTSVKENSGSPRRRNVRKAD